MGAILTLRGDAYGAEAAGAPVLIAHGLFGSAANWRSAARRFAESRPVYAVDMRNHGDSPRAPGMDYVAQGRDLLATLDAVYGRPAVLLGHSMGGKAAMAAALLAPEKVRALMVVDIAPVAYAHPEHMLIARAMLRVDLAGLSRRSDAEAALTEAAPDPAMRAFLLQNLVFEGPERRARWRPDVAAIAAAMDDLVGWPAELGARRFDGPAYSLRGGASHYVSLDGLAAFKAYFPKAEAEAIDGAGHWPHAEAPDAFLTACGRFLASIDG